MGWNGSDRKGEAPVQPKVTYPPSEASFAKQSGYRGAKKPSPIRGLVAGGLVCVLAVGAYFAFFSGSEKPEAEKSDKGRGRIKEVTPAAAPKAVEPKVEEPKVEKPKAPESDIGKQVTNAYGKVYTIAHVITTGVMRVNGVVVEEKRIFKHDSDCMIDALFTNEPGMRFYGSFNAAQFDEDFKKSLEDKIEITPEDSEEEAERKRQVIEARENLIAEMKNGGKPSDLIVETRREINKIADLRDNYVSILADMERDGASDQEIEDYYEAVNKKFAEHEIPPLLSPGQRRLKMKLRRILNGKERKQ